MRARDVVLVVLGLVTAALGFVVGFCTFGIATDIANMDTAAAKYVHGSAGDVTALSVIAIALIAVGLVTAALASRGTPPSADAAARGAAPVGAAGTTPSR